MTAGDILNCCKIQAFYFILGNHWRTFAYHYARMHSTEEEIRHQGIVTAVSGQTVSVRILQASACSGCQARSMCGAADAKEKMIEVECTDACRYSVGQAVTVTGSASQGMKAVLLACGVPVLLLIAAVAIVELCGISEAVAALAALGVMIPYFFVLWLLRDRLKNVFKFRITE